MHSLATLTNKGQTMKTETKETVLDFALALVLVGGLLVGLLAYFDVLIK